MFEEKANVERPLLNPRFQRHFMDTQKRSALARFTLSLSSMSTHRRQPCLRWIQLFVKSACSALKEHDSELAIEPGALSQG